MSDTRKGIKQYLKNRSLQKKDCLIFYPALFFLAHEHQKYVKFKKLFELKVP